MRSSFIMLNKALADLKLWLERAWFLEITFVHNVGVWECVCVCESARVCLWHVIVRIYIRTNVCMYTIDLMLKFKNRNPVTYIFHIGSTFRLAFARWPQGGHITQLPMHLHTHNMIIFVDVFMYEHTYTYMYVYIC